MLRTAFLRGGFVRIHVNLTRHRPDHHEDQAIVRLDMDPLAVSAERHE